jgi:hypothetical protein
MYLKKYFFIYKTFCEYCKKEKKSLLLVLWVDARVVNGDGL